ncbi:hypothetical protein Tco_1175722 [Tanacetum coccineum]
MKDKGDPSCHGGDILPVVDGISCFLQENTLNSLRSSKVKWASIMVNSDPVASRQHVVPSAEKTDSVT